MLIEIQCAIRTLFKFLPLQYMKFWGMNKKNWIWLSGLWKNQKINVKNKQSKNSSAQRQIASGFEKLFSDDQA
jgi:hypothetical protein